MKIAKTINMNSFDVNSGKLMITDPCYKRGTWCQGTVDNVMNGKWTGKMKITDDIAGWGNRVSELYAFHYDYTTSEPNEECDFKVGVDSGQAGIFDEALYPNGDCGKFRDLDTFYVRACNATLGSDYYTRSKTAERTYGGTITEGVVSQSGFGDGGYTAYVSRKNEKVVAVKIVFISDEELEDE